jgi:hypothetical protein
MKRRTAIIIKSKYWTWERSPPPPSAYGFEPSNFRLCGSEVLTAVLMKSPILWHTAPCNPWLTACLGFVSCLTYSSTLKMNAKCSSEASVEFLRNTWRYITSKNSADHSFSICSLCREPIQCSPWESNSHSDTQDDPHILWKPKTIAVLYQQIIVWFYDLVTCPASFSPNNFMQELLP